MLILTYGKDTLKVVGGNWVYSYWDLNPYQIRRILQYVKHGAEGKAWEILRKYPFEKEGTNAYFQRVQRSQAAIPVQAVPELRS